MVVRDALYHADGDVLAFQILEALGPAGADLADDVSVAIAGGEGLALDGLVKDGGAHGRMRTVVHEVVKVILDQLAAALRILAVEVNGQAAQALADLTHAGIDVREPQGAGGAVGAEDVGIRADAQVAFEPFSGIGPSAGRPLLRRLRAGMRAGFRASRKAEGQFHRAIIRPSLRK